MAPYVKVTTRKYQHTSPTAQITSSLVPLKTCGTKMVRTLVLSVCLLLLVGYMGTSYYRTAWNVSLKMNETSTTNAIRGSLHNQTEGKATQNEIQSEGAHTSQVTTITQPHVTSEPTTPQSFTFHGQPSGRAAIRQEPVPGEKHIIFLETRCVLNDSVSSNQLGLIVDRRGACAVASAANTNPDMKVYLLHTCPVRGDLGVSPQYVKQMLAYPNVRIWKLTVQDYMKGTPLQNWDFLGKVQSSHWPLSHSSDVLRYVTLWKYGGTYVDLDFVFLKPLAQLGTNYAGAQYGDYIASGALNFDMDTAGRVAAHLCLRDIQRNFQGHSWDQNGPAVIKRVLENLCGTKRVSDMTRQQCLGLTVLPQRVFYAIPYTAWRLLFDPARSPEALRRVQASHGVHVWNKLSRIENVTVGSEQAYGLLATAYCPRVYASCGPTF